MGCSTRSIIGVVLAAGLAGTACAQDPSPEPTPSTEAEEWPTNATVERDGLRLTLAVEVSPVPAGDPGWVTVRAQNHGPRAVAYGTDGCGLAASVTYRRGGDWTALGAPQQGSAADFKRLALRDPGDARGSVHLTPEQFVGRDGWGCPDVLDVVELEPGLAVEERFAWEIGPGATIDGGPIELAARLIVVGHPDLAEDRDPADLEVRLATAVVGGAELGMLGPVEAVDAALADPGFLAFIESAPRNQWTSATLRLDDAGRWWRVGLSVDRDPLAGRAYGEVAVDARTGAIVLRTLDPLRR